MPIILIQLNFFNDKNLQRTQHQAQAHSAIKKKNKTLNMLTNYYHRNMCSRKKISKYSPTLLLK